jgi:hypothetical protein
MSAPKKKEMRNNRLMQTYEYKDSFRKRDFKQLKERVCQLSQAVDAVLFQHSTFCYLVRLSIMISGNEMTDIFKESTNVYASSQRIKSEIIINSSRDSGVDGVIVRNATKSYGSGRNKCDVLQDLNMTVKKGKM